MINNFGKVIGIIGTRKRDTPSIQRLIEDVFWVLYNEGDLICSGGCKKGGDKFAEAIAKANGIPILLYYPNYKKYHYAVAPKERNTSIAYVSDILIACVMHPEHGIDEVLNRKNGGTEDTLRKFVDFRKSTKGIYLI